MSDLEELGARRQWTVWLNRLGPILALLFVFGLFAVIAPPSFRSRRNIETIARQTAIVGTAALGMTLIIISGGIDLSVGSVVALSTVAVAAYLSVHFSPLVAALGGIVAGAACGLVSGLLITRLRLVSFIVTLGMMLIVRGAAKGIAGEGGTIILEEDTWLSDLLAVLDKDQRWMLLPPGVWIMLLLAVGVALMLRYTRFGRHTFAVGSNEATARLCGVPVEQVKLLVFVLGGVFAGLAGVFQFGRLSGGDATVAQGLELTVIAAVVIGGGSLAGGQGSILGTLVGALIMATIRSGCSQMDLESWRQEIITGVIIIAAVVLDQVRRARAEALRPG